LLALTVVTCAPLPALADAKVIVELRGKDGAPADGTVQLTKGDSRHSCTTKAGRCTIASVPGGLYTVEVKVPDKPSPKPKQVMIPPSGEARLVVNASE
jgi:hypothetical protein